MRIPAIAKLSLTVLAGLSAWAMAQSASRPAEAPSAAKAAALKAAAGAGVEDWLGAADAAASRPASSGESAPAATQDDRPGPLREDALPGAVEFSDGRRIAGWMYTTREKNWEVYVDAERRWRQVPFITALGITAVVAEEKIEQDWRWKEMGVPERVYTGKEYPTRRLKWSFHLIDDSTLTGDVKGQPLWIEHDGRKEGPFILHERSKGDMGQTLGDLVYVKRIIVSRRLMDAVAAEMDNQSAPRGPRSPRR